MMSEEHVMARTAPQLKTLTVAPSESVHRGTPRPAVTVTLSVVCHVATDRITVTLSVTRTEAHVPVSGW